MLDGVNFRIRPGEWVSVIGRNGSGKSTLGKVCTGLSGLSRGKVESSTAGGTGWRTQLVFQNPNAGLIGETVWEDVMFSVGQLNLSTTERDGCAEQALAWLGLLDLKTQRVSELSLGQRQLLSVASAFATRPNLIVFDEATAMLDMDHRHGVLKAADWYRQGGGSVLWITHLLSELVAGDRVVALDAGRIVFDDEPEAFFYGSATSTPSHPVKTNATLHDHLEAGISPCRQLGYEPPFTVQVIEHLRAQGLELQSRPLTPTSLLKAVFDS